MTSDGSTEGHNNSGKPCIEPACVKCGSTMRFSCIEPEPNKPDFEHRLYECTTSSSTQSFVTTL